MPVSNATCWSAIEEAAAGSADARDLFAVRYGPIVRAYLAARWRPRDPADLDDALQDVFLECFRDNGVLERADPARPGGFRAFLYGVARNVALRIERSRARRQDGPASSAFDADAIPADDASLSVEFDRAWALSILGQAVSLLSQRAASEGEPALRRAEILRLKFEDGLPIREIADLWRDEPARVHHEYARAREEFRAALLDVLRFHHPGHPAEVERELRELAAVLE